MNLKPIMLASALLMGANGAMAATTAAGSDVARTALVKSFHAKNTKVFSIFVKGFC